MPSGRRNWWSILPGVLVTLFLWLLGGLGFGWYLEFYPGAYASTYGGLATAMVALVFLYTLGAIFLFGGELNGTIMLAKRRRRLVEPAPDQIEPPVELPRLYGDNGRITSGRSFLAQSESTDDAVFDEAFGRIAHASRS